MGEDWHVFDDLQGLEVRYVEDDIWEVRRTDGAKIVTLTAAEWEQVREPGPDPEVMTRLADD